MSNETYTHELSDRYWMRPLDGGWQIRYGPLNEINSQPGECIGHLHDEGHAKLVVGAVNLLLGEKEATALQHADRGGEGGC
jgi:hypothetical protein